MKARRSWIEMNVAPWPHCFRGWPPDDVCPSSFPWHPADLHPDFCSPPPTGGAYLFYWNGWTALITTVRDFYFADQIMMFDEMLELIDSRFGLKVKVDRVYVD